MSSKLSYTVDEAAEATGIGASTLRQYLREGKLGAVKNGKNIIIRKGDLEDLLENLPAWEPPR